MRERLYDRSASWGLQECLLRYTGAHIVLLKRLWVVPVIVVPYEAYWAQIILLKHLLGVTWVPFEVYRAANCNTEAPLGGYGGAFSVVLGRLYY